MKERKWFHKWETVVLELNRNQMESNVTKDFQNKYRPAFLGAKLSPESTEEESVEFFFKWLDQRKLIKAYHWVAFYMDFLCGIFTILMCYDFNIPAYGRTAVSTKCSEIGQTMTYSLQECRINKIFSVYPR